MKETWRAAGTTFFRRPSAALAKSIRATMVMESRNCLTRLRTEATRRRTDSRASVVTQRERARQLIELGGLVQKNGHVDLTDENRAAIYGALLNVVARARDPQSEGANLVELGARAEVTAFQAEEDEANSARNPPRWELPGVVHKVGVERSNRTPTNPAPKPPNTDSKDRT